MTSTQIDPIRQMMAVRGVWAGMPDLASGGAGETDSTSTSRGIAISNTRSFLKVLQRVSIM